MQWLQPTSSGCIVTVKATPRARTSAIADVESAWVRIRLQAPPVDGKANAALIEIVSSRLGVPRRAVRILSGETGRLKRIEITGVSAAAVAAALKRQD